MHMRVRVSILHVRFTRNVATPRKKRRREIFRISTRTKPGGKGIHSQLHAAKDRTYFWSNFNSINILSWLSSVGLLNIDTSQRWPWGWNLLRSARTTWFSWYGPQCRPLFELSLCQMAFSCEVRVRLCCNTQERDTDRQHAHTHTSMRTYYTPWTSHANLLVLLHHE